MNAGYGWSVVAWHGGILLGGGACEGVGVQLWAGIAVSLIAFFCIRRFGDGLGKIEDTQ